MYIYVNNKLNILHLVFDVFEKWELFKPKKFVCNIKLITFADIFVSILIGLSISVFNLPINSGKNLIVTLVSPKHFEDGCLIGSS